jgi:hypothetical protein
MVCKTFLKPNEEAIVFNPVDFLFKYSMKAMQGKAIPFAVPLNPNESLTERGKNLFDNLFSNSQFIEKINNETEKVKPSTSDNPQKYFSMNDFKF